MVYIQAMQKILETQMEWYHELFDVDAINHFCLQPDRYLDRQKRLRCDVEGEVVINFGKYLGWKLKEVRKTIGAKDWSKKRRPGRYSVKEKETV